MPPKRGRGRGRGSPRAKTHAAVSPSKPGRKPADTAAAEVCVEDPLSQDAEAEAVATTGSEALEIQNKTDTEANVPMDLGQADNENKAANVGEDPSTSVVGDVELAENRNVEQKDKSAGAQVHASLRKDVVVINDDDDVIIIDDDDQDKETVAKKLKETDNARSFWRLRVCPIPFQGIVKNKDIFTKLMAMGLNFELRMSQHLINKNEEEDMKVDDSGAPWLPREPIYDKWQAATAGLLEFKIIEKAVPDVIKVISSCEFLRNVRLRFELTKITKEEALKSPFKQEERLKKDAEDKKNEKKKEGDLKDILQVNFGKRFPLGPVNQFFLKHPEGHVKQEEDDYLFLTNVPNDLPDSILVAIMNTEMKERKLGENNTGTATFKVPENVVAEEYMARFNGILVNSNMVEMSTILGTLTDLKRLRSEAVTLRKEETKKRKLEEKSTAVPAAKKSRWGPKLDTSHPPGNTNKQNGRSGQQQGVAGRGQANNRKQRYPAQQGDGKVGQGKFFQKPQQQQNRQPGGSGNRKTQMARPRNRNPQMARPGNRNPQMARPGNRNPQMARPGNRNPQMARPGNRNPQMARPGNRNPQMARPGNRNPQMARPGNRNPQMARPGNRNPQMARPGNRNPQRRMDRPRPRSPNQSYRGPNNNRDVRRPMMRDNIRPQPLMGIGFDVKREPEPDIQIHTMADLQTQLLVKQRELNYLQNQARIQMAMIEQQEMAVMHHQRQMQQFSPAEQSSYQNWQPNHPPNRQNDRPRSRNRRR